MRLIELEPQFMKRTDDHHFQHVETIGEADGIRFLCPKCFTANKGPIGTHGVICWAPGVPQTTYPTPGRWKLVGTGLHDLSLVGEKTSSVLLTSGCKWHGHIKNGNITNA